MLNIIWQALLTTIIVGSFVAGDTPANCTYDDIEGTWTLYETERSGDSSIDCTKLGPFVYKKTVKLMYPNVAVDENDQKGSWTMVYNQGFEIVVGGRSYFAFSTYSQNGSNVSSMCGHTFPGWSRDVTVRNWACYKGVKHDTVAPKMHVDTISEWKVHSSEKYRNNKVFIDNINTHQSSWTATTYPQYEGITLGHMFNKFGGHKSRMYSHVKTLKPSPTSLFHSAMLPKSWDWRNVSGVNYIAPVRDQGSCGSCYSFASMAQLEARVRIMTLNKETPVFSPQDVLDCSELAQGCAGGFPYLIAGRYAQDVGVVDEQCSPYEGVDDTCRTKPSCRRHYTSKYRYVGGYFGACNEEEMKIALVQGGPLAVGFEVLGDFSSYKSGIYKHTGLTDHFNPLEETNHAVLLVGYGEINGEKYWSVKNSWGSDWGEHGYFKISRGNDECGFESMAIEIVPIP